MREWSGRSTWNSAAGKPMSARSEAGGSLASEDGGLLRRAGGALRVIAEPVVVGGGTMSGAEVDSRGLVEAAQVGDHVRHRLRRRLPTGSRRAGGARAAPAGRRLRPLVLRGAGEEPGAAAR